MFARSGGVDALVADATGTLFVADSSRIRRIVPRSPLPRGQLEVRWAEAYLVGGRGAITYTATATAPGEAPVTCSMIYLPDADAGPPRDHTFACTLSGLTSGVPYAVSVGATMNGGASAPSALVAMPFG